MNDELFDKSVLSFELKDLVMDIDGLLKDIAPDGKDEKDFTGGYVQQLKNSNQFVAYFGTKVGSNNRDTVKVTIEPDELDLFYIMLKAKIHSMRQENTKTVRVSMAQRRLANKKNDKVNSDGIKKPNVFG